MSLHTVAEIIQRAQTACDMVSSGFVTTAEWLRWLNVENAWLTKYMARNGYVIRENTVTITADGSSSYVLGGASPIDPIAIIGVYELLDGRYRRLRHSDSLDGAGFIDTVTHGQATKFRVIQTTSVSTGTLAIQFFPTPLSGTYKVTIVAAPTAVTATDTVEYPVGCEERLVLGLARRALAKEQSDTAEVSRQIQECEREIEELCWDRVMAAHQQVRNVDAVERGWTRLPQFPTRERWLWV